MLNEWPNDKMMSLVEIVCQEQKETLVLICDAIDYGSTQSGGLLPGLCPDEGL